MKHVISLLTLATLALQLSACVEVRDKDDQGDKKVVLMQARNLTIDEPYLLIDGELVPQRTFKSTFIRNPQTLVDKVVYQLKFDHLTFKEGGVIFTMGYNLHLEVQDLDSAKGIITTFPKDHEAANNTPGVSGGELTIQVDHARGDLLVVMKGENGGQGQKGLPPTDAMRGTIESVHLGDDWVPVCHFGQQGFPGGAGANGGDSGTASVRVVDDSGFNLIYKIEGGDGGRPGEGGDGGLPFNNDVCKVIGRGPKGPNGLSGGAGKIQAICIQLGSQERVCKSN